MPQVGAHILIADQVKKKLRNRAAQEVEDNLNAYHLGAIGPDLHLLLFDPAAKIPLLNEMLNEVVNIYRTVHGIKKNAFGGGR